MALLYRSVVQRFTPTPEISRVFEVFRAMVNDCLRLGLANKVHSYNDVKHVCYPAMMQYAVHDGYRISAMFEASNLLKKFRTDSTKKKVSPPRVGRPYFAVSIAVRVAGDELRLPQVAPVKLNRHTVSIIEQDGITVVSATLTPSTISVIYCKSVVRVVPKGMVAVDLNVDKISTFDTSGISAAYDIEELTKLHETYRRVKSKFRRRDFRIKGKLFRKYAAIEWNRKSAIIHRVSSQIVNQALASRQAIVLEDLRGLREIYTRESGSSAYYLSKMNAWPFRQILHQIAYKAEWVGLPVVVISPEWTSEKCSECGGSMETPPVEVDSVVCLNCGLVVDRDLNGAKNILKRGARSVPAGFANEAMKGGKPSQGEPSA
ncbi:MAG: transposase [Nitrososphaerota archaeon]|nr:transposase [Nitrososphaerota archaeon]MDG7024437.1 transposase [Nitrososphaerota archaeon]